MPKPRSSHRVFSREFKLGIVRRMLAGENVSVSARELKLMRKELYVWRDRFLAGGPEALRGPGRPRKAERTLLGARGGAPPPETPAAELEAARRRNAELERKVGQQQLELDFFRAALRHVGEQRLKQGVSGETTSSR